MVDYDSGFSDNLIFQCDALLFPSCCGGCQLVRRIGQYRFCSQFTIDKVSMVGIKYTRQAVASVCVFEANAIVPVMVVWRKSESHQSGKRKAREPCRP